MRDVATAIARQLQEHGFVAVFAGGAVRDSFLGLEPKDFDIATNASPEKIKAVFAGEQILSVGEAFGVIMVIREGVQVEIATFRGDGQASDGRRPDSVHFLDHLQPMEALRLDASRRDLTVNAMFQDPITGEVFDFFGGREDIANGILRAVGDAHERFQEDRLRMLRVVRFAAKLGFAVAPELMVALKACACDLKPGSITAFERIAKEVGEVLLSKNPVLGMELFRETGLLAEFLPEMTEMFGEKGVQDQIWHPEGNAWIHTMMVLAEAAKEANRSFEFMFGVFLHDIAKPATMQKWWEEKDGESRERVSNRGHAEEGAVMAKVICNRFKLSAQSATRVVEIVRMHMQMHDFHRPEIRRSKLVKLMARADIMDLIAMQHADSMGTGRTLAEREAASNREFFLQKLAELHNAPVASQRPRAEELVTGAMIKAVGFKPGPIFRLIKEEALEAQHEGEFVDADGAVRWLAEKAPSFMTLTAAEIAAAISAFEITIADVHAHGKHCC
jgi:poly(A) polymerase